MRSKAGILLVAVFSVAFFFFCKEMSASVFSGRSEAVGVTADRLTDPTKTEDSFIKFNTICLSSPVGEGQVSARTVTGASASPCRHPRRASIEIPFQEFRTANGYTPFRPSLPTLRKLRL